MRRYFWPIASLVIAAGIQGNLPDWMRILGAKPDLMLVVLISYSLVADPVFGAMYGFFAGLIHGSVVGISFGSFIVTRTLTGFFAGLVTTRLFSENPIVPALSAMWLTLVAECLFILGNPRINLIHTLWTILGECIFNAIFAVIMYSLLKHFENNRKIRLANSRL